MANGWRAGGVGSFNTAGTGLFQYRAPAPTTFTLAPINYLPPPAPTTSPAPTPPTVTGVEPQAVEAILYGKDIPLFVGGKALMGGRIVEGPYFGGTQADPTVTFVAYHAFNIGSYQGPPTGDTTVTGARLRGQEVWSDGVYTATDKLPSGKFDWRPGHVGQTPFAQSIARDGASAIAYTFGIVSSWTDIPLKPFGGIVPFPSVMIELSRFGDPDDGITRSQAIMNILEWTRFEASEYEIDVGDSDPAWLVGSQFTLEQFLANLRSIFPGYHITYTDKLRIIEPDGFEVNGELTNRNVLKGSLIFKRTDPLIVPFQKQYEFINKDRDYETDVVSARADRYPIPTTDALNSSLISMPIVTTASQATADIHTSLYEELSVKNQMEATVNSTLFGLECGDGVRFRDSDVINSLCRIMETVHDFESYTVQIRAAEKLRCAIDGEDEHFAEVILLLNFDGTIEDTSPLERTMIAQGGAHVTGDGLVLDGTSDIVHTETDDITLLSASNTAAFTIEIVANNATLADIQTLFSVDTGLGGRIFRIRRQADAEISFEWSTTGGSSYDQILTTTGAAIEVDEDTSIIVDKDSTGKLRIYVRGVMLASDTPANSTVGAISPMAVGGTALNASNWFNGIVKCVRVTRGTSRYGDVHGDVSFTPPMGPFPES